MNVPPSSSDSIGGFGRSRPARVSSLIRSYGRIGILGGTITLITLVALIRAQAFYGSIYRGWDSQFYYAMAQSLVLDFDTDITNNLLRSRDPGPFDRDGDGLWESVPRLGDGKIPNKYPIGLSLIEAPWLVVGCLVHRAMGVALTGPPDAIGYSGIEIWSVAIGLTALFVAGIVGLDLALRDDFGRLAAGAGLCGAWLGTSLFYYTGIYPFMSHAASFSVLSGVLLTARALSRGGSGNRLLPLLGLALAGLFLVRPQQIVVAVLLLPMILGSLRAQDPARWVAGCVAGATILAIAVVVQLLNNQLQFHGWTLSGYAAGGEGFSFLRPKLSFVLFSQSRGLLIYHPIWALATLGCLIRWRELPSYAKPFFWNAVVQIYLVASWSSPDQGDSFGARMLSDNAGVVALGLAALVQQAGRSIRWAIVAGTTASIGWTTLLLARYIGVMS